MLLSSQPPSSRILEGSNGCWLAWSLFKADKTFNVRPTPPEMIWICRAVSGRFVTFRKHTRRSHNRVKLRPPDEANTKRTFLKWPKTFSADKAHKSRFVMINWRIIFSTSAHAIMAMRFTSFPMSSIIGRVKLRFAQLLSYSRNDPNAAVASSSSTPEFITSTSPPSTRFRNILFIPRTALMSLSGCFECFSFQ